MRTKRALTAAVLLCLLPAGIGPRTLGDEAPAGPPPAAGEFERRLDLVRVTVDWKDAHVLDAINEVALKSGLRLDFDRTLADFAATRTVTFDGYSVSAREALRVLGRAAGFDVEPDPAAGAYRLRMDVRFPTRVALAETKLAVDWKAVSIPRAIKDIEKKTGLAIELHPTIRSRLRSRRVSWEAEDVTAREAIETLYTGTSPQVAGRIDAEAGLKVVLVYVGPPENRADVEFALDDRRLTVSFRDTPLEECATFITQVAKLDCEVERGLAKEALKVTYGAREAPLRAVLDGVSRSAGAGWKVAGAKVIFRALPPEK